MRLLAAPLLRSLLATGPTPYRVYTLDSTTGTRRARPQIQQHKKLENLDLKRFFRSWVLH